MKIKKSTLYMVVAFIAIVAVLFVVKGNMTGNATLDTEVQHIVIGMDNWVYSPHTVKVQAGVPVSLSFDETVSGCFRDVVIPELGIRQYMKTAKDTIEFTPEAGSYTFACSMYMGQGKIIAE